MAVGAARECNLGPHATPGKPASPLRRPDAGTRATSGPAPRLAVTAPRNYLSTKMKRPSDTPSHSSGARPAGEATRAKGAARRDEHGDALKLWVVLARAYASVARHVEADIARHGFTVGEFGILEALYHKGPLLLGEVQRKVLISSGGVTYLVDRLAAKGLVERRECPDDRRARYAALTRQGEALLDRIFPQHARAVERALGALSPDDRARATGLLKRLGHAAAELERADEGK